MTLYISDTERRMHRALKIALVYLCVSLFCAFFGAIYEVFSHEVYSFYMIYAFVFPLTGGTLPFLMIAALRIKRFPVQSAQNLYHSGIATFTMGSFIQGVLDIYGTTNKLVSLYWFIGTGFVLAGIAVFILPLSLLPRK